MELRERLQVIPSDAPAGWTLSGATFATVLLGLAVTLHVRRGPPAGGAGGKRESDRAGALTKRS